MANIFLLETDRQLGQAAKQYFTGHDVFYFADPQSAVIAADIHKPDVVVVDLFLAGRSGIEFLYEFRSYPDWQNLPILVTGHLPQDGLDEYRHSLEQLRVYKYIPKYTTNLEDLLAEIELALHYTPL